MVPSDLNFVSDIVPNLGLILVSSLYYACLLTVSKLVSNKFVKLLAFSLLSALATAFIVLISQLKS